MAELVLKTDFPDLKLAGRGKVRDIYDLGDALLIVTTDRISAFDVIMNEAIPDKGYVLTQISSFWFRQMEDIIPNHIISTDVKDFPAECQKYAAQLEGRSMLVKKAKPLPVECIVRGYISGSGWKDYKATGAICGITLPAGLVESDKLEEPIFTPSTKAELGEHDENISFDKCVELIGRELAEKIRDVTIAIYKRARDIADTKGIIIADTKFEYGIYNGELIIIDECMTPDSSRFWPKDSYKPGGAQPSFDKQFLRDYLETLDWGKTAPAPPLPEEIVRKTGEKYMEALVRLTGKGK
ncbi:phosphoribosylaminoimidazolesuccinocarboxamide synthase [Geobacter sulfurreducens]|jgi:phosphoribosylaminoimidazole-succinocarboxamide synthase|uniref:Phosphoribosylaminoimidazole-succinocarboxamide synthase n=1 Tax=Geobacter sulfurreducens (strain ATCC 51573 / DSM 12127 / PCA) TaxID=243231 RepID=PUR7_GEOSL|nr:phosphoribosylaminoimidazolesuccinocarboxamide synthase [Geobacter sulfurreducens]Q74BF0.1 RecName: Full=Phosphoribosylaminoimidazole-succinocarboxamide synthase; AltName: Full=SAICAR synthetase [Geobacter sulfurreducens PCA]AAR35467.1 phosphoribosylaminoimidazole-succinocarboxamide synthase [Geobacter sulfurreducens PCA]ADI84925.1 phosphoribosylaminoimidazole-succinocarboxamide synthase [Geobacter sulfurreducens KN400]AJY68314.1 phosphoribosylaminoimidazole-succinocarboxamide synthase [Geob